MGRKLENKAYGWWSDLAFQANNLISSMGEYVGNLWGTVVGRSNGREGIVWR